MISRVEKHDIIVCVLLSIITCGIYSIVWFIRLTDDCSRASGDDSMNGVVSLLLCIITCGIYGWYWNYQMGKKIAMAQSKRNLPSQDNSVLYLIISLIKFDFINYILIQNELNKLADFDHPQHV